MNADVVEMLQKFTKFTIDHTRKCVHVIDNSEGKNTGMAVNEAFKEVSNNAIESGLFPDVLRGEHSEIHRIAGAPNFHFERFSVSFGLCQ